MPPTHITKQMSSGRDRSNLTERLRKQVRWILSAEELISYGRFIEAVEVVTRRRVTVRALSAAEIDRNRIPLPFPLASHLIYDGTAIAKTVGLCVHPFCLRNGKDVRVVLPVKAGRLGSECRTLCGAALARR